MDIISHALWGVTVVRRRHLWWLALLAGALPDLISSGLGFIYLLVWRGVLWGTDTWSLLPSWIQNLYHWAHGLAGLFIFIILILIIKPEYLILAYAYLVHIILDLFTHNTDWLYRLLFPLVTYNSARVIGVDWWHYPIVIVIDALLIIVVNLFCWYRLSRKP